MEDRSKNVSPAAKRICLLSAPFPPQHSGVGDYTFFLAEALGRLGHEVHVVTSVAQSNELPRSLPSNVHVRRIVHAWGLGCLPDLLKMLRQVELDALVIQYVPHAFDRRGVTFAINLLPLLLRGSGRPCVVTNFHELYISLRGAPQRIAGGLWQRVMALTMAVGSDALSVTTSEWERRLRRLGVLRPVQVIPVGSNIPLARTTATESLVTKERIVGKGDRLLLGGFGAVHDRDVPLILATLSSLKREYRAKLVWIGGRGAQPRYRLGIERAMHENGLVEDDFSWTGTLPSGEVSNILSACDIIVLPFIDGVSTRRTSAVTALQHGLPLLTTRGPSVDSRFVHEENVYLVPVGQQQPLLDAIRRLANNADLRERLAEGARKSYEEHFAWSVIAQQVLQSAQAVS